MTPNLTPQSLALWAVLPMAHTPRIKGRLKMILDTTRPRRALTRRALLTALGLGAAALVPLAVLRPVAQAQGPGIRPGFAVVLAGITEDGSLWWNQKGESLPAPVYDTNNPSAPVRFTSDRRSSRQTHYGLKTVLLAFRFPPGARDVTVGYDFSADKDVQMTTVPGPGDSFKERGWVGQTDAQTYARTGGVHVVFITLPAAAARTSLGLRVASGPWTTASVDRQPFTSEGFRPLKRKEKFAFWRVVWVKDENLVNKGETLVKVGVASMDGILTATADRDFRVVALDGQGRELLPSVISGSGIRGVAGGIIAHFPERPEQLKAVLVQTRPFQTIAFRDVALRPIQ